MGPSATLLPDGTRLHLHHGPIDLIVGADGDRDAAFGAAVACFGPVLAHLVEELADLRRPLRATTPRPEGPVACRMHAAALPFADTCYLTRMAAVAGAVADHVLAAMVAATPLRRAYVNNGGDIALHLTGDARFDTAMQDHAGCPLGQITLHAGDGVRGIATSGRHGRSQSLGIADSVTVLARSAAEADVAATLIANAVDLPNHPAITRRPANTVKDDSDLGTLPVVVGCAPLAPHETAKALRAGARRAQAFLQQGLIAGASLHLQGQSMTLGAHVRTQTREVLHA